MPFFFYAEYITLWPLWIILKPMLRRHRSFPDLSLKITIRDFPHNQNVIDSIAWFNPSDEFICFSVFVLFTSHCEGFVPDLGLFLLKWNWKSNDGFIRCRDFCELYRLSYNTRGNLIQAGLKWKESYHQNLTLTKNFSSVFWLRTLRQR